MALAPKKPAVKKPVAPKEPEVVAEVKDFVQPALPLTYHVTLSEAVRFSINGVASGVAAGEQDVTEDVYEVLKNAGKL